MITRTLVLWAAVSLPVLAGDWNIRATATYLDGRQKEWFAWAPAISKGTPCLSCHTGLPYLMARPALRRALAEGLEPTEFENGLLNGLRSRVSNPAATVDGVVDAILAAMVLTHADARTGQLSPEAEQALNRLWPLQVKEGPGKGSWDWYSLDLDPWETRDSVFFGASLAAMAAGFAPETYRERPAVRESVDSLRAYLRAAQASQPLHNRMTLLWASTKLKGLLTKAEARALLGEISAKQEADGGWTLESLGPFGVHPKAPAAVAGSNAYATAFAAFVLREAGVSEKKPALARALSWLRSRQDPQTGVWTATSMNKEYKAGSNQIRFMQDAATAYAALALLGPEGK